MGRVIDRVPVARFTELRKNDATGCGREMRTIKQRGRSSPDGLLHLEVPVGGNGDDVEVTVMVPGPSDSDEAESALRLTRELELLDLARDWPRHEHDLARATRVITEKASRALGVARASVWIIDGDDLRLADLYEAESREHSEGVVLTRNDNPAYFAALDSEDVIIADDAHADPRTAGFSAEYLRPLGIGAMLDVPIRVGGRAIGVLCSEHLGPARPWSNSDQKDARLLASLLSLAFELDARRYTEARLADSISLLRATLEATADGIMSLDRHGAVTAHNQRFQEMWGVGASFFQELTLPERIRVLAERTATPEVFRTRVTNILASPLAEFVDEVCMADGRVLVSHARPQWLGDRIVGRVWSYRDVTAQKRAEVALREREARLEEMAIRDSLTGVFNRRYVLERLEQEIRRAQRYPSSFAIALIDIDHFKNVNDTYGHLVGDAVLRGFARELATRVRSTDVVGRFGGEEFLVIFLEIGAERSRPILADLRARKGSSQPEQPPYTFSAGLAEWKVDGSTAEELLRKADERLYEAKRSGRDRVV
jgi:diguanylate cyclase (GGDEF)-like protein/PAS domain S-box-containing protein